MAVKYMTFVGDAPKIEMTLGVDLSYASHVEIKYKKPNGVYGSFDATISDTSTGTIYYQVQDETELDETGKWSFWAYVVFNDGSPLSFKPILYDIYEPGKDYISHPFGGYTDEGGDSMPLEAFRIIYDNSSSGMTADDVQEAIDELKTEIDSLDFQTKLTPYVVGANETYTTIQDAIDQAVTVDGKDFDDPAVIIVKPGTYVEDVTLYPGINVVALAWEKSYMTRVTGMLIYDTSSGGTSGTKIASWTGIDVSASGTPGTLRFAGLNAQRLHILNCHITSTGANPAIIMTNNSGDALVVATDVDFENTSSGQAIRIDYGKLSSFKTRSLVNTADVALQVNNSAEIESFNLYSTGQLEFKDTATGLVANPIISCGSNDCIIIDSSNAITFVGPVVVGTGDLVDGASANPDNVVLKSKNQASEIAYDNTTSGLTATDVQAAIDELVP